MTPTGSGSLLANREHGRTKRNRKDPICFSPYLYRARNLVERFFYHGKLDNLVSRGIQTRRFDV
jgi:transposase